MNRLDRWTIVLLIAVALDWLNLVAALTVLHDQPASWVWWSNGFLVGAAAVMVRSDLKGGVRWP